MISDSVREQLLTRAMAFVGASIGVSFTFSLVISPILADSIGVPGIFLFTALLCMLAIGAVLMLPTAPVKRFENFRARAKLRDVFLHSQLMRLNLGIFSLHMAQMALFVVIPLRLAELDLVVAQHWTVYLPAVLVSLAFLMPVLRHAEKTGRTKELFVGAICLVLAAFAGFEIFDNSVLLISVLLLVFFSGFNVLEASLPSLVSKTAPQECKGLALGVYNTTQSVGVFIGGAAGGWLYSVFGTHGVYGFCAALMVLWIIAAQGHAGQRCALHQYQGRYPHGFDRIVVCLLHLCCCKNPFHRFSSFSCLIRKVNRKSLRFPEDSPAFVLVS